MQPCELLWIRARRSSTFWIATVESVEAPSPAGRSHRCRESSARSDASVEFELERVDRAPDRSGWRESNPHLNLGGVARCHYATPAHPGWSPIHRLGHQILFCAMC